MSNLWPGLKGGKESEHKQKKEKKGEIMANIMKILKDKNTKNDYMPTNLTI